MNSFPYFKINPSLVRASPSIKRHTLKLRRRPLFNEIQFVQKVTIVSFLLCWNYVHKETFHLFEFHLICLGLSHSIIFCIIILISLNSVHIRSFFGPYFPTFGLNKDQRNSKYRHFSSSTYEETYPVKRWNLLVVS